jgi:hypothetical protein
MFEGLRLDNLSSLGQKYPTSSDIRISMFYNIKVSQVRIAHAGLLVLFNFNVIFVKGWRE